MVTPKLTRKLLNDILYEYTPSVVAELVPAFQQNERRIISIAANLDITHRAMVFYTKNPTPWFQKEGKDLLDNKIRTYEKQIDDYFTLKNQTNE